MPLQLGAGPNEVPHGSFLPAGLSRSCAAVRRLCIQNSIITDQPQFAIAPMAVSARSPGVFPRRTPGNLFGPLEQRSHSPLCIRPQATGSTDCALRPGASGRLARSLLRRNPRAFESKRRRRRRARPYSKNSSLRESSSASLFAICRQRGDAINFLMHHAPERSARPAGAQIAP